MIQDNSKCLIFNELWPEILKKTNEPQIQFVSKFFKEIYDKEEVTHHFLSNALKLRGLIHLLDSSQTLNTQLINAKDRLNMRLFSHRPAETKEMIKNHKTLPFHGYMKLLNDESALNLMHVFKKIPLKNKPDFSHLKLQAKAEAIRRFLKVCGEVKSIQKLDLSKIEITAIPEELDLFTGLKELKLCGNNIDVLPPSFGKTWEGLDTLELCHNKLTLIPEGFGSKWTNLKHISFEGNKLASLPSDFGASWEKLEEINLNFNLLEELPLDFGISWKSVGTLGIDSNQLNSLLENFGKTWKKIMFLRMRQNPLTQDHLKNVQKALPSLILLS